MRGGLRAESWSIASRLDPASDDDPRAAPLRGTATRRLAPRGGERCYLVPGRVKHTLAKSRAQDLFPRLGLSPSRGAEAGTASRRNQRERTRAAGTVALLAALGAARVLVLVLTRTAVVFDFVHGRRLAAIVGDELQRRLTAGVRSDRMSDLEPPRRGG
jgi:hypothetical protein